MNKHRVDRWTKTALEALQSDQCGICTDDDHTQINKAYRAQISSFGSSVIIGSFKMAVLLFSKDAASRHVASEVSRSELLRAMYYIVHWRQDANNDENWKTAEEIACELVATPGAEQLAQTREEYLDASIALKNAMNAFTLIQGS